MKEFIDATLLVFGFINLLGGVALVLGLCYTALLEFFQWSIEGDE